MAAKNKILATALCVAMSIGYTAFAADTNSGDIEAAQMFTKIKQMYPNTKITDVRRSDLDGIWMLVMGQNVAYTDANARYLMFGHLYDMQTRRDVTAEYMDQIRPPQKEIKVEFNSLPLADAIKVSKGNGKRVFAVFSDPDCPYCRKLDVEMAKMDNYTAYIFMDPIPSLHPGAVAKSAAVWCAKDRLAAWTSTIAGNKVPDGKCDASAVERNQQLAQSLGIRGTPTLIAADGRVNNGYMPSDSLSAWIDGPAKAQPAQQAATKPTAK